MHFHILVLLKLKLDYFFDEYKRTDFTTA